MMSHKFNLEIRYNKLDMPGGWTEIPNGRIIRLPTCWSSPSLITLFCAGRFFPIMHFNIFERTKVFVFIEFYLKIFLF